MSSQPIRRSAATVKRKVKGKNGEDGRTGKGGKRRRRREQRCRRIALGFFSTLSFFGTIYLLVLRPHPIRLSSDPERFSRGKALRDYIRGKTKGRGTGEKNTDRSRHNSHNKNKEQGPQNDEHVNGMRYLDPRQLPPLPGEPEDDYRAGPGKRRFFGEGDDEWTSEAESLPHHSRGPKVDYTKHDYEYPDFIPFPPEDGEYPPLEPMMKIFETWGQDDIESPPDTLVEVLQHFDFQDRVQMKAARRYRDLELPFKVYNIPEVEAATLKWTDEYVEAHFSRENDDDDAPGSNGQAQESVDNFFAFFNPEKWDKDQLGPPPTKNLKNWNYKKWAQHARYADEVSLPATEKHYYWQSGVPKEERTKEYKHWTFVSRDLPSFANPEPTFFGFNPPEQKGIQCRFGERGVTAATHYDGGRNMIAMMTGAKRYVLSPPNACPHLGIVMSRKHPSYRHSMLNFGRVTQLDGNHGDLEMSDREREWLKIAADAPTLSTVLKAGEVLYVPSHWFHYITSLQKSAQCNTRSGIHMEGNPNFGGVRDVEVCKFE